MSEQKDFFMHLNTSVYQLILKEGKDAPIHHMQQINNGIMVKSDVKLTRVVDTTVAEILKPVSEDTEVMFLYPCYTDDTEAGDFSIVQGTMLKIVEPQTSPFVVENGTEQEYAEALTRASNKSVKEVSFILIAKERPDHMFNLSFDWVPDTAIFEGSSIDAPSEDEDPIQFILDGK